MSTTERPPATADDWPIAQACELVVTSQHGSPAMLQRKLRLGWTQVARLLEALEAAGIVGPPPGADGVRDVLVGPEQLDEALDRVRRTVDSESVVAGPPGPPASGAGERLIADTEALDDAHGGTAVLRGGLGTGEVRSSEPARGARDEGGDDTYDGPGAEVAVRGEGEVAEVVDAELVPKPAPARPEPVTLIGTIVQRPGAAIELLRGSPVVQTTVTAGRPVVRYLWMVGQGWVSWAHRAGQAATYGHLREQVRQARAAGDRAALGEWTERLQVARDARMKRLLMLPRAVGAGLRLVVIGLALAGLALLVGGIVVWWSDGGATWDDWWGSVGWTLDTAGALLGWLAWLATCLTPLVLVLAGNREGEARGRLPRKLTTEAERAELDSVIDERMVSRALAALGVPAINQFFKDGGLIEYIVLPRRDGDGTFTQFRTPPGSIAQDIITRRDRFAGNLSRAPLEMWPTQGDEAGICDCWIADKGVLSKSAGDWPLLVDGEADVFEGVPIGLSQRGDTIVAPVFETNWLIGGRPGQGKSAAMRTLLLGAALDPIAELWVYVFGESPDFKPFGPRLSRYAMGMDDDVFAQALQSLRDALAEMERRGKVLGQQPGSPPKVSRKLARSRALGLHPIVIGADEVHELFMHPEYGKEACDLAIRLIKRGRKYGIVLVLATQSPTATSIPKEVTRNISCGVAFSVADHVANDGLLGTGKYKLGIRATELRMKTDRGTAVTVGITDHAFELIRWFYVPLEDGRDEVTPVIARAMDGMRELRRTGAPAVEAAPEADLLRDVWEVLDGPREQLRDVLPRLRQRNPDWYTGWKQARLVEALEGECGVRVGTVDGYRVVLASEVEAALERRAAERSEAADDAL